MESEARLRLAVLLLAAALVGVVAGVVLGGHVLAPDQPTPQPEPVSFGAVSSADDDRIVHTFTPDSSRPREYRVTYHVQATPGGTMESVEDRWKQLSRSEPLVVEIEEREADVEYRVDVRIHDEFDRLVYDVWISVG